MVFLGVGAVSYERGTPVPEGRHQCYPRHTFFNAVLRDVPPTPKTTGNTFEPELNPFLPCVVKKATFHTGTSRIFGQDVPSVFLSGSGFQGKD